MDEILDMAAAISGGEKTDPLLEALCQAAYEAMKMRLRENVDLKECGKAFPVAVAAIAAKAWEAGVGEGAISSFAAGSVSLSVAQEGDRFTSAAVELLRPWMKDDGFGFQRV